MILRCPDCRTRRTTRALFTKHVQSTGHRICICGGYHYAHRKGSPWCHENPVSALLHADRHGAEGEDLLRCAEYIVETHPEALAPVSDLLRSWRLV